ncbi:MAG: putative bifunctional diguanylate cyclase/phosphodiesterase [Vicinamibacterales bacterium]
MEWRVEQAVRAAAVTAVCAAALRVLGLDPWVGVVDPAAYVTVLAFIGVATLIDPPDAAPARSRTVRIPFLAQIAALVHLGAPAMVAVGLVGTIARVRGLPRTFAGVVRTVVDLGTAAAAAGLAGFVYDAVVHSPLLQAWPARAVPMTAVVLVWCAVHGLVADVLAPKVLRDTQVRGWTLYSLGGVPSHLVGAAIAVGLLAVVDAHAWGLLIALMVPLYFLADAFVEQCEEQDQRDRVDLLSSTCGVCRVNRMGFVSRWNEALSDLTGCPPARALGRTLNVGVPAIAGTAIPRVVQEAIAIGAVRTSGDVAFRGPAGSRIVHVTVIPDATGALLLWTDVTGQVDAERASRRVVESFALVGLGANDGLWMLDVAAGSVEVSARWRELVGLPATAACIPAVDWFARVHDEDRADLVRTLEPGCDGPGASLTHEHRIRHEDGSWRLVRLRGAAQRDGQGHATRIAGSMTDITESALAMQTARDAGQRDVLTGLLNRAAFSARLAARLGDCRPVTGTRVGVLHLDVDRFKVVNDSIGQAAGDGLLVAVSRRLESALRPDDVVGRLGGDEFAVLLHRVSDEMQANAVAIRLQDAFKSPFSAAGRDVVLSLSIGIAIGGADAVAEELLRDADTAMHHAKSRGKARHELFDDAMHAKTTDRLWLESDLRDAVNSSGFDVHYQPIVSLGTRRCVGFESLVRWNRHGKAVSPADFVPMAEELGIIEPLGAWVLRQACSRFTDWKVRYPDAGLEFITVNVSARQLAQQGFVQLVEQVVLQNGMCPGDLRLEVTETALMDAPQLAARVLSELRAFGVKIYLDDFGTGYSSLSHLHRLPVDALKIDRSFVRGLLTPERPAIVESILALARTLQTNVVAEGIEDERQALELERLGCRHAQGYYFSRPVPAEAAEELLATGRTLGAMRVPPPQPARAALVRPLRRESA